MSMYQRCKEKKAGRDSCTKVNCGDPWTFANSKDGKVVRSAAKDIAFLLPEGKTLPRTKAEAVELNKLHAVWVAQGCPRKEKPRSTAFTIGDVIAKYQEVKLPSSGDNAAESILKRLKRDLGERPLMDLADPDMIQTYYNTIQAERVERAKAKGDTTVSNVTANRYYAYLSILFSFATSRSDWGFKGTARPFHNRENSQGVKKEAEGSRGRRCLEDEEALILTAIDTLDADIREVFRGRFFAAIDLGVRQGEMMKIKQDQIQWKHKDGPMLHVLWSNAKKKYARDVPMDSSPRLLAFLQTRRFMEFPFGTEAGSYMPFSKKPWMTVCKRAEKKGLQKGLHWHDLRHEAASRLGESGVPVMELMRMLGHKHLETTQKYCNVQLSSLAANMRKARGM